MAAPPPILPPIPSIPGCTMLRPGDAGYAARVKVYNARTQQAPALFAICSTASAVAGVLRWLKDKHVPFSVRSGGHSFEGFSNSPSVVIDVGALKRVRFDKPSLTVTVGAGATLGDIHAGLKAESVAFVAGTCPSVGVAGHALGGGYGLLARAYGLACDNLRSLTMVDASEAIVTASATMNADLFWASRGGGGGSLGIATELVFQVHPIEQVVVFGLSWSLPPDRAQRVIEAWQRWAPTAHKGTTALMKIGKVDGRTIALRCLGQSIAPRAVIDRDLRALAAIEPLSGPRTFLPKTFQDSVKYFAGTPGADPLYQKEKSDFVPSLSADGIATLLHRIASQSSTHIAVILNAYGGAIKDMQDDDTAFPHRSTAAYMLHYYSGWNSASSTGGRVAEANAFYGAMRSFVPGKAYVNYSDSDLVNWQVAYWGQNLPRLKTVKRSHDPANLFRFAQSIPF
jgi:FAD/FMN-containing dehydrogenase